MIKEIYGGLCGHLLYAHNVHVDTLARELRCVELEGTLNGAGPVTFIRVFSLKAAEQKGVVVTSWEAFDQHPDLVLFEGYITRADEAYLVRKAA
jgi:hypothetical protein